MPASPSVDNYFIGKGVCFFTPTGGVERDLGNAPEVELTPAVEKLDHFSSRTGTRTKDRSIVIEKSVTLRIVLEEITAENLAMLLMDQDITTATDGTKTLRILKDTEITGAFRFDGRNDVGNRIDINLPSVSFGPTGSFNPISDEWGQIEITAEVLVTEYTDGTSDFGTITVTDAA
ncbi:hypothetical protein [Sinorhizobium americanum]|uniref:Major tail protein n=1 Tax=Sinorhizobium americanum TaxID=194963 RepID=A0A4R2BTY8_9HYPH|nr:hypothetical protein [Sinorhizobium americanum]TCN30342.1 hypothetical protein EV184_108216 [Sinorhizobium americanum]